MDTREHASQFPAPIPPADSTPTGSRSPRPAWPASTALIGLLVAFAATFVLSGIVAVVYVLLGWDDPQDAASFDFVAIAVQSGAFVGAALLMTERLGRPSAREFGFRGFKRSAFWWALIALAAYYVLSTIYVVIAQPPTDDLPEQLGADRSTLLAIVTGIFVVAIAPPVEEFFFRGFIYQALRTRMGVGGGAVASGVIFGAVHLKPEFFVPLAILGTALALLFQKTDSLWPCILVHALNNAIAFSVSI